MVKTLLFNLIIRFFFYLSELMKESDSRSLSGEILVIFFDTSVLGVSLGKDDLSIFKFFDTSKRSDLNARIDEQLTAVLK